MINLMDWHGTRYMEYIPKHFTVVEINTNAISELLIWVLSNTSGRFGINKSQDTTLVSGPDTIKVGFENSEDATIATLVFR